MSTRLSVLLVGRRSKVFYTVVPTVLISAFRNRSGWRLLVRSVGTICDNVFVRNVFSVVVLDTTTVMPLFILPGAVNLVVLRLCACYRLEENCMV